MQLHAAYNLTIHSFCHAVGLSHSVSEENANIYFPEKPRPLYCKSINQTGNEYGRKANEATPLTLLFPSALKFDTV